MALQGTRMVCKLSRCTKLCLLDSRPRRFAECRPPCLTWHERAALIFYRLLSSILCTIHCVNLIWKSWEIMGPPVECRKRTTEFPISSREHRCPWDAGRIYLMQIVQDKVSLLSLVEFLRVIVENSIQRNLSCFFNFDSNRLLLSKLSFSFLNSLVSFFSNLSIFNISFNYKLSHRYYIRYK